MTQVENCACKKAKKKKERGERGCDKMMENLSHDRKLTPIKEM